MLITCKIHCALRSAGVMKSLRFFAWLFAGIGSPGIVLHPSPADPGLSRIPYSRCSGLVEPHHSRVRRAAFQNLRINCCSGTRESFFWKGADERSYTPPGGKKSSPEDAFRGCVVPSRRSVPGRARRRTGGSCRHLGSGLATATAR